MRKAIRTLALLALAALLASAVSAVGEELPAELGEADLLAPAVSAETYAEQEVSIDAALARGACEAPVVPEGNGTLGVSVSSVTIRAGETYQTLVTFDSPVGGYLTCTSSNIGVVRCDWNDYWEGNGITLNIYGVAGGSATVTITNSVNSEAAYIYVAVTPFHTVKPEEVTVKVGKRATVTASIFGYGYLYHNVDNPAVCTCEWDANWKNGKIKLFITGVSPGTATVTITNSFNSDACFVKVTVTGSAYSKKGKKDGKQKNRALLVGEGAFQNPSTRMRADAVRMEKTLKSVKGSSGGGWTTTTRFDLDNAGLKKAIYDAFKQADEDDVSLFFISTHGYTEGTGRDAGELSLIPEGREYMRFEELAGELTAVPGKVIVVLTSCGSGACIFSTYAEQNAARDAWKAAARAFDHAAIDAFAEADPGIEEGDAANTGELRVKNKFYVLTASRYQELSWGDENAQYTYLTKWFTEGVGRSGRMPADANRDSSLTLKEMFNYISKVGDNKKIRSIEDGKLYTQHVQMYPKGSGFVLFKR